jgi:hypothetical protein
MPDAPRNGSDRATADLFAMCERIGRMEAAQAGVTAKPADVVKFLDATIESLLAFAGKLLALKRIYEPLHRRYETLLRHRARLAPPCGV